MLQWCKYAAMVLVAAALFVLARGELASFRMLGTDSSFYTTNLAEITRLEKELLKFRLDAERFAHGEGALAHGDVLLSFDLLWSRVNTEWLRYNDPDIDAARNFRTPLATLARSLREIDATVQALRPGDVAGLARISGELDKSMPAISVMNREAYAELYKRSVDNAVMQRAALKSAEHLQWAFVVFGILIIGLLLWNLRRNQILVAELQKRELEIRTLAAIDPLTGLNNRRHFDERMKAIDNGTWRGDLHMLLVDLDGFKQVNDRRGHEAGDHLLRVIARRLPAAAGHDALIARLGGDEFALVVKGSVEEAKAIAQAVIRETSSPIIHNGEALSVGASIGIASLRPIAMASSMLLREADAALYMAKGEGRGRYRHFGEAPPAPDGNSQVAA